MEILSESGRISKSPFPLRESDVVALWDVFTAELREVTGYSEEMRARVELGAKEFEKLNSNKI